MKPTLQIFSSDNATFRHLKSLLSSKGIKKEGQFILSGEKLIREYLRTNSEVVYEILTKNMQPVSSCEKKIELSGELFRELDEIGSHSNLLVCQVPVTPEWKPQFEKGLSVVLPLGDPTNLGAAVRSAVGFGASEILLLPESANPFLPKSLKASAGAILHAPLYRIRSLLDFPLPLFILDKTGESLEKLQWPKRAALLVGEEGQGIEAPGIRADLFNPNFENQRIHIPTSKIESLNATVSLSIALYDWSLKAGNKLS